MKANSFTKAVNCIKKIYTTIITSTDESNHYICHSDGQIKTTSCIQFHGIQYNTVVEYQRSK